MSYKLSRTPECDFPVCPSSPLAALATATNHKPTAALYFKNKVNRGWSPADEPQTTRPVPEEEKPALRQRLLPVIAGSDAKLRANLIPALQKILQYDFPAKWPDFLDISMQLLRTQNANEVFTGLQCVLAICRTYRFKAGDHKKEFDQIVSVAFDQLLQIGTNMVDQDSLEAAEMLRLVIKSYKQAIYFELPVYLMSQQQMVGWCTMFIRVVNKPPPACSMVEDLAERELNHWWKAKKWAYANLNRLFVRYGNPTTATKKSEPEFKDFANTFINSYAPEILKAYLSEIEKWVAKSIWLSKPALSYTIQFLDECVKPKTTWEHLKPNVDNLVSHLIFPVLCMSDDDLEMFTEEPQEYVHRKLNYYEEVSAPDVAASTFLVSLTKSRKKQTFSLLTFINEIVNRYETAPAAEKNPREKEGALRMIGTLSEVLLGKNSPIAHQVEFFFVRHVFPEFRSQHGFLRARACDVLQKFEKLDFKEEGNLVMTYQNVLESLTDPELPVRIEAALALQNLIRHDTVHKEMRQSIPQIMQQLLKLANEVDVDALAQVMEDFVEVFSAELTPFAVALTEQLRDTYLRIIRELLEKQATKEGDELYGDFLDDKSITALGVLQTIGTLILTLESTPDVLLHLETILMPVIQITLENKLYDLYNEVFEIIDSCTFSAKSISQTMWGCFELMQTTFKSGAELYLEDMLPALENFVTFGAPMIVSNQVYQQALIGMCQDMFSDTTKVGNMDRICACRLAECMMLNLRGHIDQYIPLFAELGMATLTNNEHKVKSYRTYLLELVINTLYYNPVIALQVLEAKQWTNKFFSLWFSNIDSFNRVHDKKLSILAITALLHLRGEQVPPSVQQGWPRLMQGAVKLFATLPAAIKNREEASKEGDFHLGTDDDDEWEGDQSEWQDGDEDDAQDGDVKDESAAYLEFLDQEVTVSLLFHFSILTLDRLKSLAPLQAMTMMMMTK